MCTHCLLRNTCVCPGWWAIYLEIPLFPQGGGERGYSDFLFLWWDVRRKVRNLYQYLRISWEKMTVVSWFLQIGTSKMNDFNDFFFSMFVEWYPLLRIFGPSCIHVTTGKVSLPWIPFNSSNTFWKTDFIYSKWKFFLKPEIKVVSYPRKPSIKLEN